MTFIKGNAGYWLGKKRSDSVREALSKANKGKPSWNKGLKMSDESKSKMSAARLGKSPWNKGKKGILKQTEEQKKKIGMANSGEKSSSWKGSETGYRAIHSWVNRWKIKPEGCEYCGKIKKRMHWANIDHAYNRILADYIYLCPKCHGEYDKNNQLRKNSCRQD